MSKAGLNQKLFLFTRVCCCKDAISINVFSNGRIKLSGSCVENITLTFRLCDKVLSVVCMKPGLTLCEQHSICLLCNRTLTFSLLPVGDQLGLYPDSVVDLF